MKVITLKKPGNQHGVAVISAMLLAALTTLMISQLIWEQYVLLSELENYQDSAQARMIGNAATQWTRAILAEDTKTSKIDHLKEPWARKLPLINIEGAKIQGEIVDQQQFFNLNSLETEGTTRELFSRLIQQLKLSKSLSFSITDWIDKDDSTFGADGAESIYYQTLSKPYRAGNQPLSEIGNLIRIKHVNKESLATLEPWVTVLPTFTEININTASPALLTMLLGENNASLVPSLIAQRNVSPFIDITDLGQRLNYPGDLGNLPLTTKSQFFTSNATVIVGKSALHMQSLLYRDASGWPKIIWQRVF